MNKSQAKKFAYRWLDGLVEQHLSAKKSVPVDPMVYDNWFVEDLEGRRLSKEDEEKVWDAIADIVSPFAEKGRGFDLGKASAKDFVEKMAKATGKPGKKYGKYKDYRKRIGY